MRHGIARITRQRRAGKAPGIGTIPFCRSDRCEPGKGRRLPRIERRRAAIALRRKVQ